MSKLNCYLNSNYIRSLINHINAQLLHIVRIRRFSDGHSGSGQSLLGGAEVLPVVITEAGREIAPRDKMSLQRLPAAASSKTFLRCCSASRKAIDLPIF
jgi:hypothetical protein